jgi:hypothetical protein
MGERVDEVEIEHFVKTPGIVEHQGFFIQVPEDRYELIIILHIPLVRDGIVNIFPSSGRVHGQLSSRSGIRGSHK